MARPKSEDKKQALLEAAAGDSAIRYRRLNAAVIARSTVLQKEHCFAISRPKDELINLRCICCI